MGKIDKWCVQSPRADDKAVSSIVHQHVGLVKRIAHHLLGRLSSCVQLEDLVQAGMIGLLEAAKNYDVSKGASFETYASIRIRGSMLDEVRRNDWVPRSVHRNTRRIAQAIRNIENELGRDARDHEVAVNLELSLPEYHELLQEVHGAKMFALFDIGLDDEMVSEGLGVKALNPLEGLQREDFKACLAKEIENLPEREQLVLAMYYDKELNLREVGDVLGVSESRVSQIHSQAMLRLQARLKEWSIEDRVNR
jgi:RNA polymerase sigma factor FliA